MTAGSGEGREARPSEGRDWSSLVAMAGLLSSAALLFTIVAAPTFTNDFWFHLAMGEVYFTEGLWPDGDPLLHTAHADAPVQHEWLFGVGVYLVERLAGFHAVRVAHVLAVVAALWLAFSVARRETRDVVFTSGVVTAFLLLGWTRFFQVRPDLFSIIATLLVCPLILRPVDWSPSFRVAAWAMLSLVWVNAHSLFALGPLLLIAGMLGLGVRAVQELWLLDSDDRAAALAATAAEARVVGMAFVVGLLCTLVNPRGLEQHATFFSSSREAAIWSVQDEWSHFDPFHVWANPGSVGPLLWGLTDFTIFAFTIASLVGVVATMRRDARARELFDPVLFGLGLAACVALLVSVRFLWLGFFPLLFALRTLAISLERAAPRLRSSARLVLALACCVLALLFHRIGGYQNVAAKLPATLAEYVTAPYMSRKYHVEGVRFLRDAGVEGHLFNSYAMGGFLGYWLAPGLRTFVDSRTEHYPPEVLIDYGRINKMTDLGAGATFLDLLERAQVDFFFGVGYPLPQPSRPNGEYTTAHLDQMPGWIPVSRSLHHAIYMRKLPRNERNLDRIAAHYEAAGIPFDRERGLDVSDVLAADPDWALESGLLTPSQAQRLAGRVAGDDEQRRAALETLGLVYSLTGDHESSLENELELARIAPESAASHRRRVHALMRLGRAQEALDAAWTLQHLDLDDSHSQAFVQLAMAYRRLAQAAARVRDPIARRVALNRLINQLPLLSGFEAGLLDLDFEGQPRLDR